MKAATQAAGKASGALGAKVSGACCGVSLPRASGALVAAGTCCGMSLPQCLERAACQLRSGEGCAQELPKAASWKPVSKFTPGARAPRVAASPGCEEKDDQAAWPFSGFHV